MAGSFVFGTRFTDFYVTSVLHCLYQRFTSNMSCCVCSQSKVLSLLNTTRAVCASGTVWALLFGSCHTDLFFGFGFRLLVSLAVSACAVRAYAASAVGHLQTCFQDL